jgi:uncharacterized protein (TIGR00266 family)
MKYEIKNQPFTVLTLHMDKGESVQCQSGAMAWMTDGVRMETKTGGLGGILQKAIAGESIALNHYIADKEGELTLAKHSPGDIIMFDVSKSPIVAQKTSFLASTEGVNMDIFLQKKLWNVNKQQWICTNVRERVLWVDVCQCCFSSQF